MSLQARLLNITSLQRLTHTSFCCVVAHSGQESFRDIRAPDIQSIRRSRHAVCRFRHVEQIAIHIVLHNEASRVKPVFKLFSVSSHDAVITAQICPGECGRRNSPIVKDLTAHDVPANTPAVLVALLAQPIVTQDLGVKVVRLERRVVDVHLGPFEKEEAVVVNLLRPPVQAEEDCNVLFFLIVGQLLIHKKKEGKKTNREIVSTWPASLIDSHAFNTRTGSKRKAKRKQNQKESNPPRSGKS